MFPSKNPQALLSLFVRAIDEGSGSGSITTWEEVKQGVYSHKSTQWRGRAGLKPRLQEEMLVFNIVALDDRKPEREVYSFYLGHIIMTFLDHFSDYFDRGSATAKPTSNDTYNP